MLVFDEPSASMDTQTEQGLIDRLQSEVQGRTMVLVTHRPPLLQLVQRIIVMERGKIVLDGSRDQVMQQLTRPKVA